MATTPCSNIALTGCDVMPGGLLTTATSTTGGVAFADDGYASTAFFILCACLMMIMAPAVGLLYGGLSRTEHALSGVLICCLAYSVVAIQWLIWGFSLAFSETSSSPFIGNLEFAGLRNVDWRGWPLTAPSIPVIALSIYQLQVAALTVCLIFGSTLERIRILPAMVFTFVWSTVVYDPIAYWVWGARGWVRNMACLGDLADGAHPCHIGALDFAGGGPVHMAAGASALALCLFLGPRRNQQAVGMPHNIMNVFLGTGLLWMGWLGFNAAGALAATPLAAVSVMVTIVGGSAGGLAWSLEEYVLGSRKFSGVSFCMGVLGGLVGITPAGGYVAPWAGAVIGAISALCCAVACRLKIRFGYDDTADAWGIHGVAGFVGTIMTALFADAGIQGIKIRGGVFFNNNGHLMGYNVAMAVSVLAYSFVATFVVAYIINKIPGLRFRMEASDELQGSDLANMGEAAYTTPSASKTNTLRSERSASPTSNHAITLDDLPVIRASLVNQTARAALAERRQSSSATAVVSSDV